jgi:regulator of sigma E protease
MSSLFILEVVLAFGFMIAIHEGGHYLACRLFKVGVEEFALGFGPILFSRKWGGTLFSLRPIPLGGFCKPQGGDLSGQSAEEIAAKPLAPGDFNHAAWWKRVVIFLAGPAMNLVSAYVILFLVLFAIGQRVPNPKPVLGFVPPGSYAAQAGLKAGDEIKAIAGKGITAFYKDLEVLETALLKDPKIPVEITVLRSGKTKTIGFKGDLKAAGADAGLQTAVPPVLGTVHVMTPARKAGLKAGDRVMTINGKAISDWGEVAYLIRNATADEIRMEVTRGDKTYPIQVTRVYNGVAKMIGIGPQVDLKDATVERHGFFDSLALAGRGCWDLSGKILDGLGKLVTGKVSLKESLGGPVSIMRMMYQNASSGLADFLGTVAVISMMLFIMNLLPLGIVDGGQIVLCVIEGAKRGPIPVKVLTVYQNVGVFLIGGLMLFAVFNDFFGIYLETFRSQFR